MNINEFKYLVEIEKQESITKAANALFISQPALSKFLSKLEDEVGSPVFHRIGKKFVPTELGLCMVKNARQIIDVYSQMSNEIFDLCQMHSGTVKLGMPMSRTTHFISEILPQFKHNYPNVNVIFREDKTSQLMQLLLNGEINIVLANYEKRSDLYEYIDLDEEEMVLAVHEQDECYLKADWHSETKYPMILNKDWMSTPFIMLDDSLKTGQYMRTYFNRYNIKPNVTLEFMNLHQALYAVKSGLGVTITPSFALCKGEKQSTLKYLSMEGADESRKKFAIIYRKECYLSIAEQQLITQIKDYYWQ